MNTRPMITMTRVVMMTAALLLSLMSTGQVLAVSGSDWKAGLIADDVVFTTASAMSVQEIQAFLNARVPTCDTWGTQPSEYGGGTRAQYGASQGNPTPFTCLKDYYEVPKTAPSPNEPASNYGGAPIPAGAQSAAQLIANAAIKYNISPKVLLVKLATESAGPLTSDDWPFKRQYLYAMGAHCPDSGPGGAANCDANYAGFSLQMDEAAALLRWYIDNMNQPWWQYKKPYQVNHILWRVVESGCGGNNVYIDNRATAALYTYTPYQPNQAALNNLYGTGDGCSSYGNRNFWRVFSDWFGSTQTNIPYAWSYVDQAVYLDSARTQRLTYHISSLQPNSTLHATVRARNMGYQTWTQDIVRLGTARAYDRQSTFTGNDWLSPSRIQLQEAEVKPGDIGTFRFTINSPAALGTHREYFNLLAEGVTWMNDPGLYFQVDVTPQRQPINNTKTTLLSGESLMAGTHLMSADTQSIFKVQGDGNLVLYSDFRPTWASSSFGSGKVLVMQGDGNLVLYGNNNVALWESRTNGNPGAYLILQTDGNAVVYTSSGQPLWNSESVQVPNHLSRVNYSLARSQSMHVNQSLMTANLQHTLILQEDGNLVLYAANNKPLWNSGTVGKGTASLNLQADGNLVLYSNLGKPLWNSGTVGKGTASLNLQADGNLVLYDGNGGPVWATGTVGQ